MISPDVQKIVEPFDAICLECGGTGVVSHAEHDPRCVGDCARCPVEVPEQCSKCHNGRIEHGDVRRLAAEIEAAVTRRVSEDCAKMIEAEPLLPGPMPKYIEQLIADAGLENGLRALIRGFKRSLLAKYKEGQ